MNVIVILILASLAVATGFLVAFILAMRSGQFEDTATPSLRVLADEAGHESTGSGGKNSPSGNRHER